MSEFPEKNQRRDKVTYLPNVQRLLPQSPDAERALLGSLLLLPQLVEEYDARLTPEHFHIPAHYVVFELLIRMNRARMAIDLVTLTQALMDENLLEQIGGAGFVAELFTFVPTAANASYYAEIITEKFILRRIILTCTKYAARSYDEQENVHGLLEEAQGEIIEIGQLQNEANTMRHIKDDVVEAFARYESRYDNRGKIDGLATGFVDLDRTTDGLKPSRVYVIAGRPAMGKTSFGLEVATHIALASVEAKSGVAMFSVEMTRDQVVDRMMSSRAEITQEKLRRGFLSERDFDRMKREGQRLMDSFFMLDDTGGLTIAKFRSQARRAVVKHKARLILVDYVQLMKGVSKRARENEAAEISEVMKGIVETAKELKVAIVALAQVNREGEQRRSDHRPSMADLKGSGAIEEGAYLVGLLHRPVYYCQTPSDRAKVCDKLGIQDEQLDAYAELNIVKHRNGGVGQIKLNFIGEFTRYQDTAEARERPLYSNNPEHRQ